MKINISNNPKVSAATTTQTTSTGAAGSRQTNSSATSGKDSVPSRAAEEAPVHSWAGLSPTFCCLLHTLFSSCCKGAILHRNGSTTRKDYEAAEATTGSTHRTSVVSRGLFPVVGNTDGDGLSASSDSTPRSILKTPQTQGSARSIAGVTGETAAASVHSQLCTTDTAKSKVEPDALVETCIRDCVIDSGTVFNDVTDKGCNVSAPVDYFADLTFTTISKRANTEPVKSNAKDSSTTIPMSILIQSVESSQEALSGSNPAGSLIVSDVALASAPEETANGSVISTKSTGSNGGFLRLWS